MMRKTQLDKNGVNLSPQRAVMIFMGIFIFPSSVGAAPAISIPSLDMSALHIHI
jgi:hypothetical protein